MKFGSYFYLSSILATFIAIISCSSGHFAGNGHSDSNKMPTSLQGGAKDNVVASDPTENSTKQQSITSGAIPNATATPSKTTECSDVNGEVPKSCMLQSDVMSESNSTHGGVTPSATPSAPPPAPICFENPMVAGNPLDCCFNNTVICAGVSGGPADLFCKQNGHYNHVNEPGVADTRSSTTMLNTDGSYIVSPADLHCRYTSICCKP